MEGDVILKVLPEVNSVADLRAAIDSQAVGSKIDVVLDRHGSTITVGVLPG